MDEKGKNSNSQAKGARKRIDEQLSGLVKKSKTVENSEDKREVTDILLGQISLFIASDAEVKTGYRYNFMNSRTILLLGSDQEKCRKHGIVLEYECVSPVHASVRWQEGQFILQDEGSKQGTFLEGKKLVANTCRELLASSSFRLGTLVLEYRIEYPAFKIREIAANKAAANMPKDIVSTSGEVVVAEFCLLSMDAPYALPRHCEILSQKPVFTLGRAAHCNYPVEFKERYVSEEQAAIIYSAQEGVFLIKELDKGNPTLINDHRIKEVQRLSSGDVIRLGVASNAPRVRFTLTGQQDTNKEVHYLAQILPVLERNKTYLLGNGQKCDIEISVASVCGVVAEIQVPERGERLLVRKLECQNRVSIDDSEVKEGEMRVLSPQQTLQVDESFALIHDHGKFITARVPEKCVLSQFISTPQRDEIYLIGSAMHCTIRIPELDVPQLIGEISAPLEGEYFLVKKYSGVSLKLYVDSKLVPEGSVNQVHYGVNQVLAIHDYLTILNNHRSLPVYATTGMWKKFLKMAIIFIILATLGIATGLLVKKYWPELKQYTQKLTLGADNGKNAKQGDKAQNAVQNLMKKYQKNVFYVLLFQKDQNEKKMASGTAFLITQTDAQDRDSYYLVTSKHVIEPWIFEKYREKDGEFFNEQEQKIDTNCYIAVWPYGEKVLEKKNGKWSYLLKNSFSNAPVECLGTVKLYRKGNSDDEALDGDFRRHRHRSNEDIAILELKAKTPAIEKNMLKSRYQRWSLYEEKKLDVGLSVIVLGYARGGERLIQKGGTAQPANCKGTLASTCQNPMAPEFLEIDANQTQGASGGPIIDLSGKIVGMVSFSDSDKMMIYGIHSLILRRLLLKQ